MALSKSPIRRGEWDFLRCSKLKQLNFLLIYITVFVKKGDF